MNIDWLVLYEVHVNGTDSKLKMAAILEHNNKIPVYGEIKKTLCIGFH
jgi:hypothetical protein